MKRTIRYVAMMGIILGLSSISNAQARLNYKQEQDVKDAIYYIDNAENAANQIADALGKWKVGDTSVSINDVNSRIAWKDDAIKKLGYADERFKRLPADHPKVKSELERYTKLKEQLAEQEIKLKEIKAKLDGVVNQGEGEGFKKDFDRLKEINKMFANEQIINSQPEKAIDLIKQISAVKTERARIAEKYADLMKQPTASAKEMNDVLRYFDEVFGRFDKYAQEYKSAAPGEINSEIDKVLTDAKNAAADKKFMWFGEHGGIPSQLKRINMHVALLSAFDPQAPAAAEAASKLAEANKQITEISSSLETGIIEANRIPSEQFNGADKAELTRMVKEKWTKEGTGAELLKVGMNSQGWQRDTRWEWNNSGWYKIDRSRTQGFVVYKLNDETAAVMYVNLSKDHLSNDRIAAYFFDDVKADVPMNRKILMKNIDK